MSKIAVLGERESVLMFRALGLETVFAESRETAVKELHRLAREDTSIIYVTEDLAQQMLGEIAKYKESISPAVILIPGSEGSLGLGLSAVTEAVERAVGADILGDG